jgi:hypothetical protein
MEATFQRVAFGPGCPTSASKTDRSARPERFLWPTPCLTYSAERLHGPGVCIASTARWKRQARKSAIGAKPQRGSILLRVRFLRTSGLIEERERRFFGGQPSSLRGHQLNFPIALAEAIPLNVWKLGLAPVSRQYRTKSSAPTSIKMTSHPLLCQFAISFAWRKSHFSYDTISG